MSVHTSQKVSRSRCWLNWRNLALFIFAAYLSRPQGYRLCNSSLRERMLQAQRLIRETSRSLIEIGLEVGYTSPSHFAQVFRRTVGKSPSDFRMLFRSKRGDRFSQECDRHRTIPRAAA